MGFKYFVNKLKRNIKSNFNKMRTDPFYALNAIGSGGFSLSWNPNMDKTQYATLATAAAIGGGALYGAYLAPGFKAAAAQKAAIAASSAGSASAGSASAGAAAAAAGSTSAAKMSLVDKVTLGYLGANTLKDIYNTYQSQDYADRNFDLQEAAFKEQQFLNRNQYSIQVADALRAGINPMAFTPGALNTSTPAQTAAPYSEIGSNAFSLFQLRQNQKEAAKQRSHELLLNTQNNETATGIAGMEQSHIDERQRLELAQQYLLTLKDLNQKKVISDRDYKLKVEETYNNLFMQNQSTRAAYEEKRATLYSKAADSFTALRSGGIKNNAYGKFSDIVGALRQAGYSLSTEVTTAYNSLRRLCEGLFNEGRKLFGKDRIEFEKHANSLFESWVNENFNLPPYEDIDLSNLEGMR